MELRHFSPAQTLMLLAPLGVAGRNLMKYSFLDLVFNGYLKVYRDWRLPHPRSHRERLYTFVSRGERFHDYSPNDHQDPFIAPFLQDDREYQVRTLIQKIYGECGRGPGFKRAFVYKELQQAGYFKTSSGLKYLNFFVLSKTGIKVRKQLKAILDDANANLSRTVYNNPEEAKKILSRLGSNVLLLENFNDELVGKLKPIFEELGNLTAGPKIDYLDRTDQFELLLYAFLDNLDHFNSSFESFDTAFDFSDGGFGSYDAGDFGGDSFGDI